MNNNINELPKTVQASVRATLKYYKGCSVTRSNGRYGVVPASVLDNSVKPADFKVWNFNQSDVLSQDEINEGIFELNKIPESAWY